ncbi:MAG: nucleotidyltransferase domain-containing protein [archaeon]
MDKILEFFIKEPETEFHVRQISKLLNKSPTTVSKYLKKLEKEGVLVSEKKLNHLLFKANAESQKFKRLKLNYNLEKLSESSIVSYLAEEFNHPEAIVLFGSFSKAENIARSDIDLLIVSSLKKEINLEKFERKLGYKIQLILHSKKEIDKMKEKNKELMNSIINGITLYGFWEVFR